MGTSVNQPSPDTPSWRLARALLGRTDARPADQAAELWRAATADRARRLQSELSDPLLADAAEFAARFRGDPQRALERYDEQVYESRSRNFALELGRRALARATISGTGPGGFGAELFAEATSYYVARDLPGFIGSAHRVNNAREALDLKAELQNHVRHVASTPDLTVGEGNWVRYVGSTLERLTRRRGKRQ